MSKRAQAFQWCNEWFVWDAKTRTNARPIANRTWIEASRSNGRLAILDRDGPPCEMQERADAYWLACRGFSLKKFFLPLCTPLSLVRLQCLRGQMALFFFAARRWTGYVLVYRILWERAVERCHHGNEKRASQRQGMLCVQCSNHGSQNNLGGFQQKSSPRSREMTICQRMPMPSSVDEGSRQTKVRPRRRARANKVPRSSHSALDKKGEHVE